MKQRFTKRTRLVSALLTLAMVFTFLPFSAFAANTEIDFNSPDFQLDFPDAEFQRFLKERCDTNHNGKLDAQELSITEMTITDDYKIKNLEGIRFFEDLEKLDCHGIGLTTLNVGKNFKLRELDCSYNQLKDYLYILSSGLKILNCSHNNLTSMDLGILSGLKLEEVDCSYNKIWRIVMRSEEELIKFDCSNNELTALDVSRCYQLKQLNCSVNQLVELDVKNQTNLTLLDCHHNELIELNVSRNQNLASLTCDGNQLTTLDLSKNNSLSHLSCAENRLACVDFSHMVGSTINADGNRRPIAVRTDGKFDLATLPGFDVSKATNWTGGSVSDTTLSVNAGVEEVSYQYDCGKGVKPTFIFETSLPINEKNFPDPNFRKYIKTYKAGGRDVLTVEEQRKVESIEVKGWNISNLKGIEAFPNLKELNCENNSIQKLDLRQNPELEKLICNKNQLTQLDLSKNPNIYFLNCSWNQLEQLDVSHLKDLVTLDCSHNDLEQLDVKNSKSLVALNCSANQLTELDVDVTHKPNLERVECQNNQLTSLILGQNKLLKKLNCAHNQLTQLNLNNMISLKDLNCFNNQLTVLDVSDSPKLTTLWLGDNHLTSLNLDNNPKLDFSLTDIYSGDNVYTVTLNPDRTFDLSILPAGFDVNKASGWVGGTVSGKTLKVKPGATQVTYTYDCGKGFSRYFTLNVIVIPDGTIFINASNFPDAVFRDQVKWKIADGNDTLTEQQRNQLQELSLPQGIKDLKGIEYFENLEKLEGVSVGLKYLDVTKNKKLKHLNVDTNQLEYLKVTENTGLEYLHCGSNQLTELDVTHNRKLSKLWCYNNQFTKLDVSKNSDLVWLGCGSNSLTELDVSRNPKLEMLLCFDNQLTELDLSKNTALTELDCSGNHLTSLELTSYIKDTDFKADGNVYDITIDRTDRTFDLSGLPGNFKPEKVQQWNGGSVKSGTSILTVDKGVSQVTYTYDCGFSRKAVFTLRVTETGSAPVDPPVTPPSGGDTPGGSPGGDTPGGGSTGGGDGDGDGGGAVVIVAAAGAAVAGVIGYGVYNYVSGQKLQALLPEGVAAPDNRAQTALLLWNTAGRPEPADAPAFADVADPDTAKAAQWCVEQGLMKRRLNGKFAPGSSIPAYQVLNAYRKLAG